MSRVILPVLAIVLSTGIAAAGPTYDFETGDMQGWEVIEGGFDRLLTDRVDFHHSEGPYNKEGMYFLSTLEQSDNTPSDRFTGLVRSPEFVVEDDLLSLLVGGGQGAGVGVGLCLAKDDTLVRWAQGANAQPMHRRVWDLGELTGQPVYVVIVDRETGGWGHITLDDLRPPTDEEARAIEAAATAPDPDMIRKILGSAGLRADSLERAIQDLKTTFGARYPMADDLLERLTDARADLTSSDGAARNEAGTTLNDLAREALLANPLLTEHPIAFVVRAQYVSDHHNTATLFQTGEINTGSFRGGGALKVLDVATGSVQTLIDLPEGLARDLDTSFDGERVLFSMRRNIDDDYHVYEIDEIGAGLKQLTFGEGVSDIDPMYLPDGRIAFSSTREPKYCMCNRHIMGNVFRMDADGANIHQIGKSTLFEGHPNLMPDGRILYDRWEYIDRNFGDAQGLWTCNPDGTEHNVYWGNNTPSPGAVLEARVIPGTQKIIANFSSCHDRPWGALAIVDRALGVDGKTPVLQTWPASAMDRVMVGNYDQFVGVTPKYEDPFPLSDKYFLCSRMTGKGEEMGIYLIDVFGNEVLVHVEGGGCYDAMPLAARERPPTIPDAVKIAEKKGRFYVHDVYQGTGMDAVERGSVKYLRVVESPEKRFWTQDFWNTAGQQAPAMNWHDFNNKRILGTVPVKPDGSVYFKVPADTYVYFQLLDEKGMMVQSMRSGVITRPGETTGCIGCHDERSTTVPTDAAKTAYAEAPVDLTPWYGEARLYSYAAEVQPVFDQHCVSCHDYGQLGAEKVNLSGDRGLAFSTSYNELWRKGYTGVVGAGPAEIQAPYAWGSHNSKLIQTLLAGHQDVELDRESFERIATWIDINAPYYPTYASAYHGRQFGRSPLTNEQLERLGELTGTNFRDHKNDLEDDLSVSFDRPDLSPCLADLPEGDVRRAEALAIIEAGSAALAERPRADMAGFAPAGPDAGRQEKYDRLEQLAMDTLEAMRLGHRVRGGTQATGGY